MYAPCGICTTCVGAGLPLTCSCCSLLLFDSLMSNPNVYAPCVICTTCVGAGLSITCPSAHSVLLCGLEMLDPNFFEPCIICTGLLPHCGPQGGFQLEDGPDLLCQGPSPDLDRCRVTSLIRNNPSVGPMDIGCP